METFVGHIKTPQDALVVFEACRRGQLTRVQRRLSSRERIHIRSGSVFAWDEREAGMRRWTDGRTWSPSRVLGSFLTYHELDTKRRPRRPQQGSKAASACAYKPNGLIKQSFSICTAANQKIHLISYYTKADILSGRLGQPSNDLRLRQIVIPKGLYPELNPLDTSGGHPATLHSLRQVAHTDHLDELEDGHPTPPPMLSTSPTASTDDEEVCDLLPSPRFVPLPAYCHLPTQDITWGNLPSSEDNRQLRALRAYLRM